MTILFAGGFPGRIPPAAAQYLADIGERDRGLDCPVEKGADSLFRICTAARNNSRNVLLIGDSHAMMFRSALAGASGANIMQVTATGCVLDRAAEPVPSTPCAYRIRQTLNGSIDWPRVSVIILSSRWQNLNEEQLGVLITTLKAHAPVIVIGPTPDYDQRVPQLLARAVIDRDYRVPSTRMLPRMRELDERVRAASTRSGAAYLSPMRAMCRATICAVSIRGRSLYLDSDHLTAQSAALLLRKLITTQLPRSGLAGEVLHALRGH